MSAVSFLKVQGLGNDFIILEEPHSLDPAFGADVARTLCDRNFGIGADGVMLVLPGERGHARMRIYNADGSIAEMCGNGIRCFAMYLVRHRGVDDEVVRIDTDAGLKTARVRETGEGAATVCVAMGAPEFEPLGPGAAAPPIRRYEVGGRSYEATVVSMGNPHLVIFVDALSRELADEVGRALVAHPDFPAGTNVELALRRSPQAIELFVYERGVGLTLACGTGACATVAAACRRGLSVSDTEVRVLLPGGACEVRIAGDGSESWLSGPATEVFRGSIVAWTTT